MAVAEAARKQAIQSVLDAEDYIYFISWKEQLTDRKVESRTCTTRKAADFIWGNVKGKPEAQFKARMKHSAFRKVGTNYDLRHDVVGKPEKVSRPDSDHFDVMLKVRVFTSDNKREAFGWGAAGSDEKGKWPSPLHVVIATAETRAKCRAMADLTGGVEFADDFMTAGDYLEQAMGGLGKAMDTVLGAGAPAPASLPPADPTPQATVVEVPPPETEEIEEGDFKEKKPTPPPPAEPPADNTPGPPDDEVPPIGDTPAAPNPEAPAPASPAPESSSQKPEGRGTPPQGEQQSFNDPRQGAMDKARQQKGGSLTMRDVIDAVRPLGTPWPLVRPKIARKYGSSSANEISDAQKKEIIDNASKGPDHFAAWVDG